MPINFPDAPSVNDTFTVGDVTWLWDGTTWADATAALGLDGLSGTSILSPVINEVLQYDGSNWVNADVVAQVTASIVDSAPVTLDTLNELAAALGDDANFATTVTNSLAGKALTVHAHVISDVTDLQTSLDSKTPLVQTVSSKTANYTLVIGDSGNLINCSGTFTLTIPSATFSAGDRIDFINIGTGVITFAGSGVTVNSVDAAVTIDTQWAGATFFFTSSTAGVLIGKLA
jgi:hypothetical protein